MRRSPDTIYGLSPEEVEARVRDGQVNRAPPSPGRTVRQILRANVFTRFNAILGALLVVVAVVGPVQDGLFGVVLVVNTAIGIAQELRAKRTLDRLAILTAPRARVVRDGTTTELAVDELVVDDILELQPGDEVAVDGLLLRSDGLEIDESMLSGESQPVSKQVGEAVLSGTFVVAGGGVARATVVGDKAYAAQMEARARRFSLIHSELQQGTNQILRIVTWVMVPVAVALVASQLLRSDQTLADALRGSVAGVSAMVPEGLVLLTSIAFALGALRLARRRVLVQELAAIEGLARVDVLCIDKTGTLTSPGMHVESLQTLSDMDLEDVQRVIGAIAASDPAPNATMRALGTFGGISVAWQVAERVPFSSRRKWSAVSFVNQGHWILGAPDVIGHDLNERARSLVTENQRAGRRVLLLSRTSERVESGRLPVTADPVAMIVVAEHLRSDAIDTIRYLRSQDVDIKVLSGDAPETVGSIAERAGIAGSREVCDASQLGDDLPSLDAALSASNVFGRVKPEQKLDAITILQARGHVVAMVGDGVNDIQALKQADLGIAMGSGAQSSRSVARIVLLDSTFSSVPKILGEGRRVIANIGRVASLFVTKTVYAALLAVVVALIAVPFPFFPRHLTIVSTFTIGIPGFFLALASGAPRASSGFTRRVLAFAVPAGMLGAAATFLTYAIARASTVTDLTQARTAAMLALSAYGLGVLGVVARPLTSSRLMLLIAMTVGLLVTLSVPAARRVFSLQIPPGSVMLTTALVVGGAICALVLVRGLSIGYRPSSDVTSAAKRTPRGTPWKPQRGPR
jgi:cation-transporting P-type ATPase E